MQTALETEIAEASTKGLQGIYECFVGRPTSNRNAQALRARLLKMPKVVADINAQRAVELLKQRAAARPPTRKAQREAKQARENVEATAQRVKARRTCNECNQAAHSGACYPRYTHDDVKTSAQLREQQQEQVAAVRHEAIGQQRKPGRIQGLAEKLKHGPVTVSVPGTPLDILSNTKSQLAAIPAGVQLVHAFKDGRITVCVLVLEAMTADGKGGRFRLVAGEVEKRDCSCCVGRANGASLAAPFEGLRGLREIVKLTSGHAWNVLLFFRRADTGELLKPYPVHRDRLEKRAARQASALTPAERETVHRNVAADLDKRDAARVDLATPAGRAAVKLWASVTMWAVKKGAAHGETRRRPARREAGELRKLFDDCPIGINQLSPEQRVRIYDLYKKSYGNAKVLEAATA